MITTTWLSACRVMIRHDAQWKDVTVVLFRAILDCVTLATNRLGIQGEGIAANWLEEKGWTILSRRFVSGHRDIDLVGACYSNGLVGTRRTVAFIEVKTRKNDGFGGPLAAVNWKKQRELRRSANIWIDRLGKPGDEYRFDVIGILMGANRVQVQHIENAIFVPTRS